MGRGKPIGTIVWRQIDYLWEDWIPKGYLGTVIGDPGVGKTTAVHDIACRLSRGATMPDGWQPPAPIKVLIVSMEEGAQEVLGPRLGLMGGHPENMHYIAMSEDYTFPRDINKLEEDIKDDHYDLVVIDPLWKAIGMGADLNNNQAASAVLKRFSLLCDTYRTTIIFIHHLNKGSGAKAMYRSGGAISIPGSSRFAHLIDKTPEGEIGMVRNKGNLGPPPVPLAFELAAFDPPWHKLGKCVWLGPRPNLDADEMVGALDARGKRRRPTPPKLNRTQLWLTDYMDAYAGVCVDPEAAFEEARELGITRDELSRARRELGIESAPQAGGNSRVVWSWPVGRPPTQR